MARIDVGEAATAGFRLIGRRPVAVLMWGLAYFVLVGLPVVGLMAWLGPSMMNLPSSTGSGEAADMGPFFALQSRMQMINPLIQLVSLAGRAVLTAAVFRAILRPNDSGFFYLRLGADEGWQALLYIVLALFMFVVLIPVMLGGAAVGFGGFFAAKAAVPAPWTGWVQALLIIVAVVGCLWGFIYLALRFSLAAPLTFADRTFRMFESWTLTRGHTLQLFLVFLVLMAIMFLMMIVFYAVMGLIGLIILGSGGFNAQGIEAFFQQPTGVWLAKLAPVMVVVMAFGAVVTGAFHAIIYAPFAEALRQLTDRSASGETPVDVFS